MSRRLHEPNKLYKTTGVFVHKDVRDTPLATHIDTFLDAQADLEKGYLLRMVKIGPTKI